MSGARGKGTALFCVVAAVLGGVVETGVAWRGARARSVEQTLLELVATSAGVDLVVGTTPFGLWRSFDAVNAKVKSLEAVRQAIPAAAVSTEVQQGLADWDAAFVEYKTRFEDVKSKRAALTNIEHYLPTRLRELQVSFPSDVVVSAIRSEVLAYLLAPTQEHLHAIEVRVAGLREVPLSDPPLALSSSGAAPASSGTPPASGASSSSPTALQAVAAEAGRLQDLILLRRGLEQASTDLTRAPLARTAAVVARVHRDVADGEARKARQLRFGGLIGVMLVGLALLWRRPRVVT